MRKHKDMGDFNYIHHGTTDYHTVRRRERRKMDKKENRRDGFGLLGDRHGEKKIY
jgi:hypothetical protein